MSTKSLEYALKNNTYTKFTPDVTVDYSSLVCRILLSGDLTMVKKLTSINLDWSQISNYLLFEFAVCSRNVEIVQHLFSLSWFNLTKVEINRCIKLSKSYSVRKVTDYLLNIYV